MMLHMGDNFYTSDSKNVFEWKITDVGVDLDLGDFYITAMDITSENTHIENFSKEELFSICYSTYDEALMNCI